MSTEELKTLPSQDGMSRNLLIQNARLIDGTGNPPQEGVSLLIANGRIAKIGRQIFDQQAKKLDAGGLTVLPGLIDSHVHLASVPGSVYRHDSETCIRELRRTHLRAYLACGVTTVLDAGMTIADAREIQSWLDHGHPGPRMVVLSPAFTTPHGYLAGGAPSVGHFFPPVSSPQEVEERFSESDGLNAVGVKVFLESGFGASCWPIHAPEIREAIRQGAARRKLPLYIHTTIEADTRVALDMGAFALAHLASLESGELIARLKQRSAYVTSTLSIQDAWLTQHEPERLDDSLVQLTVPPLEIATARQPDAWKFLNRTFAQWLSPDAVDEAMHTIESNVPNALAAWKAIAGKLHEAGLPIVVGTDSGAWPLMPCEFHGPTTLREMELLGASGLSAMEVIQAATLIPSRMLGVSAEIGTVEVGKQADLAIVQGNPLEDLRTLRNIKWTVKGGIARSPEEWMTSNQEQQLGA